MTDSSSHLEDIFADLTWRGLIHQTTDPAGMPDWLSAESRTLYAGFDPTADSLHVGHLVALLTLRRFQHAGHRPIALVGGATGMIGDPSGKSEERNLLSREQLVANVAGMESQMRTILDFDGPCAARLVNNFDWMQPFSYLDFLRDVGKNFPVNVMLAKDSVKMRLERTDSGLSYTEFSYMLLQAYDFAHLNRQFGCGLQIGGSDQWGNITAGIDLARRMQGVQLYGLTFPLLTKSDGSKMGKTEAGAIWLSPERTSPYQFYQYWINVEDADVGRCLRIFTELSHEEIEELDRQRAADSGRRDSQRRLAEELTRLVHGDDALAGAKASAKVLFRNVQDTVRISEEISATIEYADAPEKVSDAQLLEVLSQVPARELARDRLVGAGLNVVDAFCEAGLTKSKAEARRLILQGGAYVNNVRVTAVEAQLTVDQLASETVMVLRSGKRSYALLRFVD